MEPSRCAVKCIKVLRMRQSTLDKITRTLGEVIGTAMLMFLGCMGCAKNEVFPNNNLQTGLNFGLTVMIIIQIFGCVSGAHLNPAVTLAAFIYNMITWYMGIIYFIAQLAGALIGYGLLKAMMPGVAMEIEGSSHALCITAPIVQLTLVQAVFIEFVITIILVAICCGVWDPRNAKYQDSVPVRFGLAVACLSIAAGPFTGASMNPVRSLSPAIWNNDYDAHWIYWVGPLCGSVVASLIYKAIFRRKLPEEEKPTEKVHVLELVPQSP